MWFVGHQTASYRDVADRLNITLSSLHRIIERVTYFLSNYSPQIIKWPNNEQIRESEKAFRENGFPMVIGAIDGCHIKIDKPDNDPDSCINRKGYYSIQMQVVCDHKKNITDFFAGYPGSIHDSWVFRNSPLCNSLQAKCGSYFLLGDNGYPLQNNLMTPFKDRGHLTRRQMKYNLKNIVKIVHFMRACCVLYNISLDNNFLELLDETPPPTQGVMEVMEEEDIVDDYNAKIIRDTIVAEHFI
ncbi:hypothetical protein QTP88_003191 [Uroleucon formosanum]